MKAVPRVKLFCEDCGKPFLRMQCELTRGRGKYCSVACRVSASHKKLSLKCARCGSSFERTPSQVGLQAYCSRTCYDAARPPSPSSYPKIGGRHEHRIVAEAMLCRPLTNSELVHHKDEVKHNNEPDNFAITDRSNHARIHFKGKKQSAEQISKRVESRRETLAAKGRRA